MVTIDKFGLKYVLFEIIFKLFTIPLAVCDHLSTNNRTGRYFNNGVTNTHGWNTGLLSHAAVPSVYFDYGINVPTHTYLPPWEWPDYANGYHYSKPPPTSAFSEPPSDKPIYLPPQVITSTTTEFMLPEVVDAKKQIFTPNRMRETKQSLDKSNRNQWSGSNVFDGIQNEPIKIVEMKCDSGAEGHFRAILQWFGSGNNGNPVFEDARIGNFGTCRINVERSVDVGVMIRLDVTSSDFPTCGVNKCSDNDQTSYLCVRLRFPTLVGMKLIDDTVLTLRCRIQEPLVIHTKHVVLPVNSVVAGRSPGVVATGGASNEMRCHLEVLRRGSTSQQFSTRLEPGAQVLLGEELLVRVTVADGDGWQFSRLGEVAVSGGTAGDDERQFTLLTSDGCVATEATLICPQQPRQDTPLSHSFIMRAPMFQNNNSGSNIRLIVQVVACRRAYSCAAQCSRLQRSLQQEHKIKLRITANNPDAIETGDEQRRMIHKKKYTRKHIKQYEVDKINEAILPISDLNENDKDIPDFDIDKQIISVDKYKTISSSKPNVEVRNVLEKLKNMIHQNTDTHLVKEQKQHRRRRSLKMMADSIAELTFTVVQPTPQQINERIVQKGVNDKTFAMIIVLSVLVAMLMLAVVLAYLYCKHGQKDKVGG